MYSKVGESYQWYNYYDISGMKRWLHIVIWGGSHIRPMKSEPLGVEPSVSILKAPWMKLW